jgi:hypothetical protein
MIPWEMSVYTELLVAHVEEETRRLKEQQKQ